MTEGVLCEELIRQQTKKELKDIRKINLWALNLSDITFIEKMPALEIICLSMNKITSLRPFSKCEKLTTLFLQHNEISNFKELQYLTSLPVLKTLWLIHNPIYNDAHYRERVISLLPKLIKLDEAEILEPERKVADVSAIKDFRESDVNAEPKSKEKLDELQTIKTILSLLPELSNEGLAIIERAAREMSKV